MAEARELLPPGTRTVVLIALAAPPRRLADWTALFAGARVHRFDRSATPAELDEAVAALEPIDVIVDLSGTRFDEHRARWRHLYFQLEPHGHYLVDLDAAAGADPKAWVTAIRPEATDVPRTFRDYAAATDSVTTTRHLLSMRKRGRHYFKLREPEVRTVLPTREPAVGVDVLAERPGGTLTARARPTSHEATVPIRWLPAEMDYPPLHLRHYIGRIAFYGHTLLRTDRSILPDSFRWPFSERPRHPKVNSTGPRFGELTARREPPSTLDGDYYQLDPQYTGHFGHIMTEVVGRLWGWDEAKKQLPDLKAIFRVDNPERRGEALQRRLLTAYGIAADDIVAVDRPTYLRSVASATVMYHNAPPHYVHPGLQEVWQRLGRGLIDPAAPSVSRVFVSRADHPGRRACRNVFEVEKLFAAHGFEIIYPERYDIGAQAGLFASASVIAGFGGSGLFNLIFADRLEKLIVLNHESYVARNEHLFGAVLGFDTHYFWSPSDVPQPEEFRRGDTDKWNIQAFRSAWEFDFDRHRAPLEELLRTL